MSKVLAAFRAVVSRRKAETHSNTSIAGASISSAAIPYELQVGTPTTLRRNAAKSACSWVSL